jgi:hypothetical protein
LGEEHGYGGSAHHLLVVKTLYCIEGIESHFTAGKAATLDDDIASVTLQGLPFGSHHVLRFVLEGLKYDQAGSDGGKKHILTRRYGFGFLFVCYYLSVSRLMDIDQVVGYHDIPQRSWTSSTAQWNSRV